MKEQEESLKVKNMIFFFFDCGDGLMGVCIYKNISNCIKCSFCMLFIPQQPTNISFLKFHLFVYWLNCLATLGLSLVVGGSTGYSLVAMLRLLTKVASLVADMWLPKMFAARFFLLFPSHITKGEVKEGEFGVERNSKVSCWRLTHLIFWKFYKHEHKFYKQVCFRALGAL